MGRRFVKRSQLICSVCMRSSQLQISFSSEIDWQFSDLSSRGKVTDGRDIERPVNATSQERFLSERRHSAIKGHSRERVVVAIVVVTAA